MNEDRETVNLEVPLRTRPRFLQSRTARSVRPRLVKRILSESAQAGGREKEVFHYERPHRKKVVRDIRETFFTCDMAKRGRGTVLVFKTDHAYNKNRSSCSFQVPWKRGEFFRPSDGWDLQWENARKAMILHRATATETQTSQM